MAAPERDLKKIVDDLRRLPQETTWLEFKQNNADPDDIGEYISALANSAALAGSASGYVVWGVEDQTHRLVGTTFEPASKKVGNEDLIPWLHRLLAPAVHFTFREGVVEDERVVLLELAAAQHRPVQWKGEEWVRIGSYKKKMKNHPEHARQLWAVFESHTFESLAALSQLEEPQIFELLDVPAYFELTDTRQPDNLDVQLEALLKAGLISWDISDEWSIRNLGALLVARSLEDFPKLDRKPLRVVKYRDRTRVSVISEQVWKAGYAVSFEELVEGVEALLPTIEEVGRRGIRRDVPVFPSLAMRELLANMLIHQELNARGTDVMVEIFDNRIEFTNPGKPLIDWRRFIDNPSMSRNEHLAKSMRQMGICEERGSGWDRVMAQVEFNQLPAPLIEVTDTHTRVVLFGPMDFTEMQKSDRMRAVYLHTCLKWVHREQATNTSVRQRFGLPDTSVTTVSRLIKATLDEGLIVPHDSSAGLRSMSYVPYWSAAID